MLEPLVSIVVPMYNVEEYISECLDSILMQDYGNIEIICIDDCSNDDTVSIIESYQKKDQRIYMIKRSKNSGPSTVRNEGLYFAKGKYILFVDGDDLISENLVSKTVLCAEKNNLDEVSFGYRIYAKENEWKWKEKNMLIKDGKWEEVWTGRDMLVMQEKMSKYTNGKLAAPLACTWLYNRDFLIRNNLCFTDGISVGEDALFWFQCCLRAKRVMIIGHELYFYRKNTGSLTTGWKGTRAKSIFSMISLIYAEWIKNSFSEEENVAIYSFLRKNWSVYMKAELRGETEDIDVNPAIDCCFKFFHGTRLYKYGQLKACAIDELKTAKNIFVYGAGAAAADVFDQLKSMHIKPVGVMVTKMKGNTSFFGDVPVKTLGEWGLVDDATVIIAVTGKYSNGIESMLRQKGYKRIIKVKETEC